MAKQGFRIAKEIKDEIINKLKHDGLSVKGSVSLVEYNRLKKENDQLKQLIGEVTLKLSTQEKRG